jgi:hypothetical protein
MHGSGIKGSVSERCGHDVKNVSIIEINTLRSDRPEELIESHNSMHLRAVLGPEREVGIATYDDEPVKGQVLKLKLIEDIRVMFFEGIVAEQKLASDKDSELKDCVESCAEFSNYFRFRARTQPFEQGFDKSRTPFLPGRPWFECLPHLQRQPSTRLFEMLAPRRVILICQLLDLSRPLLFGALHKICEDGGRFDSYELALVRYAPAEEML